MEAVVRADREEAGRCSRFPGALDHRRQIRISERVAVVGQKHLVIPQEMSHSTKPLADARMESGIDKRDVPVMDVGLQELNLRAALREHEVIGQGFVVVSGRTA